MVRARTLGRINWTWQSGDRAADLHRMTRGVQSSAFMTGLDDYGSPAECGDDPVAARKCALVRSYAAPVLGYNQATRRNQPMKLAVTGWVWDIDTCAKYCDRFSIAFQSSSMDDCI